MTTPFPRQLVLGHRGAPRGATENTLHAFARAVALGADGVELDIRRSRDGIPVVIHDDSLRRTASVTGDVSRLPWPAIERLTNALVPSFEQAAAWAAAAGAWLNVEMKAAGVEAEVAAILRRMELGATTVISSFDPQILHRFGQVDSSLRRFLLSECWDPATEQSLAKSGAGGLCLRHDAATPAVLEQLRLRSLPVVVWTVNDPVRMKELFDAGVAALISDDPGTAVRVRDGAG